MQHRLAALDGKALSDMNTVALYVEIRPVGALSFIAKLVVTALAAFFNAIDGVANGVQVGVA